MNECCKEIEREYKDRIQFLLDGNMALSKEIGIVANRCHKLGELLKKHPIVRYKAKPEPDNLPKD